MSRVVPSTSTRISDHEASIDIPSDALAHACSQLVVVQELVASAIEHEPQRPIEQCVSAVIESLSSAAVEGLGTTAVDSSPCASRSERQHPCASRSEMHEPCASRSELSGSMPDAATTTTMRDHMIDVVNTYGQQYVFMVQHELPDVYGFAPDEWVPLLTKQEHAALTVQALRRCQAHDAIIDIDKSRPATSTSWDEAARLAAFVSADRALHDTAHVLMTRIAHAAI